MKVTLVGLRDSGADIFPMLGPALAKKISGVEIAESFAVVPEDIPIIALEAAMVSDFLVVFAQIDDEDTADFVRKKLVDVELSSRTRILKMVDEGSLPDKEDYEFGEALSKLVETVVGRVVKMLFDESASRLAEGKNS